MLHYVIVITVGVQTVSYNTIKVNFHSYRAF